MSLIGWRKSSSSMPSGNCVEVGKAQSRVVVRDSANPSGVQLRYPGHAWSVFVAGVKSGKFKTLLQFARVVHSFVR
jgi:hypothetical protein